MKAYTIAIIAAFGSAGSSKSTFNGFADSCSDITLIHGNDTFGGRAILRARCKIAGTSDTASSGLNLNNCFGWDDGACTFFGRPGGSNFTDKCWHPEWNGLTLSYVCGCPPNVVKTAVPLDDYIGNDSGQLVC